MKITISDDTRVSDLAIALSSLGLRLSAKPAPDGTYQTEPIPAAPLAWQETRCDYQGCRKVRPTVQLDNGCYCAEHAMTIMQSRAQGAQP